MTRVSPEKARERASKALELRRAGVTYEVIAERLDYNSRTSAFRAVQSALKATGQTMVTVEVRDLEIDRLDRLQASWWPRALAGDARALDRVLKIMAHRARLYGLDVKPGLDVTEPTDDNPKVANPLDEISARRADRGAATSVPVRSSPNR